MLNGLHGDDFDKEFVQYMIDDHQKDISDFQEESRENHGAISALARKQLPALQKHLRMAQALNK